MAPTDTIAANLRTLRKLREMPQQELAEKVGISPRTLARLEHGEVGDPGIGQVRALAQCLGVTVDWFTAERLVPLTVAVPERVAQVLGGPDGARILARITEGLGRDL
jgi:transcriptional regulator with XRE-family HTH domain